MCGCNKKSTMTRTPAYRPAIQARSVVGGVAAGASPETVRALSLQSAISPKQATQLNAERLDMLKRRREAIRAKFNK